MPQNNLPCEGKLAIVTGAGTGIGRGAAEELARQGADVVLNYHSNARGAQEALAEIEAMGRRAVAIQADLSRVDECRRLIEEGVEFLGGLDALVNNSGYVLDHPFLTTTEEQFDYTYGVNIRGQYFCSQQAVPHMTARGKELGARGAAWAGGSIVNISSVHGYAGFIGHTVYAGTKGAINAFTRSLAVEVCPEHIRVNAIGPGVIEVPDYWNRFENYSTETAASWVPWGRVGLPKDIAALVAFLVSDASEFITGQNIYVDGGTVAKMSIPEHH